MSKEYEINSDMGESIVNMTEVILEDVNKDTISSEKTIKIPIAQLSALGAGVASLIPGLNTVTNKADFNAEGLYRIVNSQPGDVLKKSKDGTFWGAMKKSDGGSRMAKLAEASPISATNEIVMKTNPSTILMSAALMSIEKDIRDITEMQKKMMSFMEIEKESEIEADVVTLTDVIAKYKYNWDNERYVASHHKQVCDIQRNARKHIISYQKRISEELQNSKKIIVGHEQVKKDKQTWKKELKFYRLALYAFSLASFLEIMLSGNYKEENITAVISDVRVNADSYRDLFSKCSVQLERSSKRSVETNILKGIGNASNAVGKVIGSIPKVSDGPVDEFLQDKGKLIKSKAYSINNNVVSSFADMSNPNVDIFVKKMEDMILIYNHTSDICIDKENVYLIAG